MMRFHLYVCSEWALMNIVETVYACVHQSVEKLNQDFESSNVKHML